mgnify:CR=1 FL=1
MLKEYDEYLLLKRSGAKLPIDGLEFIDPILNVDKNVLRVFCVAGAKGISLALAQIAPSKSVYWHNFSLYFPTLIITLIHSLERPWR